MPRVGPAVVVLSVLLTPAIVRAQGAAGDPIDVAPDDAAFAERARYFGEAELFLQRIEAEREELAFDERAARFVKILDLDRRREAAEEAAFNERALVHAQEMEFTRRLEADAEARSALEFEEKLSLTLRIQTFMRWLEQRRQEAESFFPNELSPMPAEWQ